MVVLHSTYHLIIINYLPVKILVCFYLYKAVRDHFSKSNTYTVFYFRQNPLLSYSCPLSTLVNCINNTLSVLPAKIKKS